MPVFARDPGPSPDGLRTFAGPVAATAPKPSSHRLMVAATAADVAQAALAEAKARYQRGPTEENRAKLFAAAEDALAKEVAFDEIWEAISKDWFGGGERAAP